MIFKKIFLVLLILTLPSKLIGDTDIDDNNHQFNLYLGNFDFSDDKQKAALLGFQHQNESLNRNTILVTALNPIIGYKKAAEIAKKAYQEQRAIIDVAEEMTTIERKELESLLDPKNLIKPYF